MKAALLALAAAAGSPDADFAAFCDFVQQDYAYGSRRASLDWPKVCEQHRRQARGQALLPALERALSELADAHAHFGRNTRASVRLVPSQSDLLGRQQGGRVWLDAVREPSAAWAAGLRAGDEVLSLNGRSVDEAVRALLPRADAAGDPLALHWALQQALAGRHEQRTMRLLLRREGQVLDLHFDPRDPPRRAPLSLGRIGAVGWIRLGNSLGDSTLAPAFDAALTELADTQALVLDLRDTPSGGNSSVARALMGRFVAEPRPYQRHEAVAEERGTGVKRLWVEWVAPRGERVAKPLVVLVGPWTGSMGEGLAIGLQAAIGAPVLGRTMAGLLGALGEFKLPHSGLLLRLPVEALTTVDGLARERFQPEILQGDAQAQLQQAAQRAAALKVLAVSMK